MTAPIQPQTPPLPPSATPPQAGGTAHADGPAAPATVPGPGPGPDQPPPPLPAVPEVSLPGAPHGWWRTAIRRTLFGRPRDLGDRSMFHRLSLVAFLAWVGLGADGLSSSSYGPAEGFLALGDHQYLALVLALITPATVLIIASAYSRIIEAFPQGGGGYVVATKLLGPGPGVVSGAALLVDYVLTITVSIAAAGDAMFSMLPVEWQQAKVPAEMVAILLGITINIRGVKESVLPLVPIFLLFLVTHALLIFGGIAMNISSVGGTAARIKGDFQGGLSTLGFMGMAALVVRAYSLGAGTYTGIEAVSNGLNIMREPRVQTGKRTMRYMAISLAITAAGLLVGFLLMDPLNSETRHIVQEGVKTLNAVLAERVVAGSGWWGDSFVFLTMLSEAAILVVAAQTGFLGGPRVLANMALDGWVPRRFASLSDRLTTQNGIVLMGVAAMVALLCTGGHVRTLVLMYSINVFITFSLSMGAMLRMAWQRRRSPQPDVVRPSLSLFAVGLVLCVTILAITSIEKFTQGGWYSLAVTASFVVLCFMIRSHYRGVSKRVAQLQRELHIPEKAHAPTPPPFDPTKPTAAVLVGGYSGLGIHTMLGALTSFGGHFKNVVFVSVGVIDTGAFKGQAEMDGLKKQTEEDLKRYVELAGRLGVAAQYRYAVGLEPVDELEKLCMEVQKEFGRVSFFAGQLTFRHERWFDRILHNQTAFTLQRRLHWAGIPILILPIRVR